MILFILLICLIIAMPALADGPLIVAFGDSITLGSGLKPAECYPAQLQALLREQAGIPELTVVNAGIGGNTVTQGLARLDKDVLACRPCAVLIGFDMNDSVMTADQAVNVPTALFREALSQMVRRIQAAGAKVILAPVTPVLEQYYWERHPQEWYPDGLQAQLDQYTVVIREVARQTGAPVIDLKKLNPAVDIQTPENSGARDGVHPTAAGCAVIAAAYAEKLMPLLRQR